MFGSRFWLLLVAQTSVCVLFAQAKVNFHRLKPVLLGLLPHRRNVASMV